MMEFTLAESSTVYIDLRELNIILTLKLKTIRSMVQNINLVVEWVIEKR